MNIGADEGVGALTVAMVSTERDREQVARLRYDVYVREQGKAYANANHVAGLLEDEFDESGCVILLRRGEKAVGTVRVNHFDDTRLQRTFGDDFNVPLFTRVWKSRSLVTCTRLAIALRERGAEARRRLFDEIYRYGQKQHVRLCFVHCAHPLLPLFRRYGFREFLPPLAHRVIGVAHRLALIVEDAAQFQRVRSPFVRLVRAPEEGKCAAAQFERMVQTMDRREQRADSSFRRSARAIAVTEHEELVHGSV